MFRFLTVFLVVTVLFLAIGTVLAIYNPASEAYIRGVLEQKAQSLRTVPFTFAELASGYAIWKYEHDLRQAAFAEGGQIILLIVTGGIVISVITAVLLTMRWRSMGQRLDKATLDIQIAKREFQNWHGQAVIQKSMGRLNQFYNDHPAQPPGAPGYPMYHNPPGHVLGNRNPGGREPRR
jgi:cell division protein FtsL